MKLEDFLQKEYGYNPDVKNVFQTYIEQWKSWYKGNVKDFHNIFLCAIRINRITIFHIINLKIFGFFVLTIGES